jgi:hypothetical protein
MVFIYHLLKGPGPKLRFQHAADYIRGLLSYLAFAMAAAFQRLLDSVLASLTFECCLS